MSENQLRLENHLLVCINVNVGEEDLQEYSYLKSNFCGRVLCAHSKDLGTLEFTPRAPHGVVYVCGDIGLFKAKRKDMIHSIKVIREFSYNLDGLDGLGFVTLGEIPINLHNVAVYYRNYPATGLNDKNYFDILTAKHKFQALTESNKPGRSFRKGVYLSEVETNGDSSEFHLLRCSTNLDGPTLAFVDEDREIVDHVNKLARHNFEQKTSLNHVLAQVYENVITVDDDNKVKERKAKIKSHSDKTKDMPPNGLIVFCTFYSSDISYYKTTSNDRFDRYYNDKGGSVLTSLRFKLKSEMHHLPLAQDFRVPLYPNSILLIPLSTNRLYTHETVPPMLPVGKFPTRLGYVVRCSKTKAVFKDGATFIQRDGKEDMKLREPMQGEINELKELYFEENTTAKRIEYKEVYWSFNAGDYERPLIE